jgi:hypothetical protein
MNGFDTNIGLFGEDTNTARRAREFGKVKFKFDFVMPTSGRRLVNEGIIKTVYIYLLQFLSEVFRHKPATQKYTDIR